MLRWQASAIARLEARTVRGVDAVLACSELDAAALRRAGAREVHLVPNGVELRPAPGGGRARNTVAFVGSYDWRPNVDAAVVLARENLATVRSAVPGTPPGDHRPQAPPAVRELAADDIEVTGRVDDVAPWLAALLRHGDAAPRRLGDPPQGARGGGGPRPDRRHPARLRGPALPWTARTSSTPRRRRTFVDALLRLRREPGLASRLTEAAWPVAQEFDWRRIGARLVELYRAWSSGERARPPALSSAG